MLLYNHKQEFIGIDAEGLRLLNYASMGDLLNVCSDVADLFANEPGYIHNFKNFGWIDFLLHADSDASSAIVHANGRVFSCKLSVSSFYLSEFPLQNGFSIEMSQIQTLSGEEVKPHIIPLKTHQKEYTPPPITTPVPAREEIPSPLPDYTHIAPTQLSEPTLLDIPNVELNPFDEIEDTLESSYFAAPEKEFVDELIDSPFKTYTEETKPIVKKPQERPMLGSERYNSKEKECLERHNVTKNYIYDPQVAANELGLPVDLIEEFIGDFIQQSHDFKDALFESAAKADYNNLHILSHKLKGVAANLRIENAFETLSIVNTSTDPIEIDANLKFYFDIIKKLSGEAIEEESTDNGHTAFTEDEDIYSFGLKQHEDEPLIVNEEEILPLEEVTQPPLKEESFEKVLLDLDSHEILPETTDIKAPEPEEEEETPIISLKDSVDEAKEDEPKLLEPLEEEAITVLPEELVVDSEVMKIHYDKNFIAQSLGINSNFMDELLFDYKNDSRLISNQITEAIKAFDTQSWNTSAAKLKGISDNLRLNEISEELAILSKTHDAQEAKKASLRLNAYLDQL